MNKICAAAAVIPVGIQWNPSTTVSPLSTCGSHSKVNKRQASGASAEVDYSAGPEPCYYRPALTESLATAGNRGESTADSGMRQPARRDTGLLASLRIPF
jgi:hypothetical protein